MGRKQKKFLWYLVLPLILIALIILASGDFSRGEFFIDKSSGEIVAGTKKGRYRIGYTKECHVEGEPEGIDLRFHAFSFRLMAARCKSIAYETAKGAAVGDNLEQITKLYGLPDRSFQGRCNKGPDWVHFEKTGLTFSFDCETTRVKEIKLRHNRLTLIKILRIQLDIFNKACRNKVMERKQNQG